MELTPEQTDELITTLKNIHTSLEKISSHIYDMQFSIDHTNYILLRASNVLMQEKTTKGD